MQSLPAAVSAILRGIAAKYQVDQRELARRTGYHQVKISRLFSGKTTMGIEDADIICQALGVALPEIIAEAIAETPDRPRKSTPDVRLRRM